MPLGLINISEANSIAIHLCTWIAYCEGEYFSTKTIAGELGFSHAHSAKVVQQLVHAGILETVRGPSGGSRLARPADEITLLEIITASGGNHGVDGCMMKPEICNGRGCILHGKLKAVNDRLLDLFGGNTLADVVKSINQNNIKTSGGKPPKRRSKTLGKNK